MRYCAPCKAGSWCRRSWVLRMALEITAVLDWEWAHAGEPVEDLAWCEWIVRMHDPRQAGLLAARFPAPGPGSADSPLAAGRARVLARLVVTQARRSPGKSRQWTGPPAPSR